MKTSDASIRKSPTTFADTPTVPPGPSQARIAERIGIVRNEIENQIRDQNACLEQLQGHRAHLADRLEKTLLTLKPPTIAAANVGGDCS